MEDISESNDENLDENIVEAFEQNTESCGDDATSKPEPIASYISIMLNIINTNANGYAKRTLFSQ